MERPKLHVVSGQRSVGFVVTAQRPWIGERARLRIRPAGHRRERRLDVAHHPRVHAVAAVEVDAGPIDELFARPKRRGPQRVEFIENPGVPTAHAARAGVEADRESLSGNVVRVLARLERAREKRPVVVQPPGLDRRGLRPAGRAGRQCGEIVRRDRRIPVAVAILQECLADVVDHVVLLRRHHPGLGDHQAVAVRERPVHRIGVAAVLEFSLGEPQGRGERAGSVERAVAVGADAAVEGLAPREGRFGLLRIFPVGKEGGVVDR